MVESVRQRSGPVLLLQAGMLLLDLALNTAAPMLYKYNTLQLVLYILQDTCIVMNLIILFLSFFATLVFQAGLISLLVSKFQSTIYFSVIYLALSISYHVWSLREQWDRIDEYIWTPGLIALYVIHRLGAIFYYYLYKRTALMLGDPRYYQDSAWLRSKLQKHS